MTKIKLFSGIVELKDKLGNPTSTGFVQAEGVHAMVVEWGTETKIVALVFDTTASNKGHLRGAAVRLQALLKLPLLFHGCHHHVGELLAKKPWHKIFSKDPALDVKMFVNIKNVWRKVDTAAPIKMVNIPDEKERKELVELFSSLLVKENIALPFTAGRQSVLRLLTPRRSAPVLCLDCRL